MVSIDNRFSENVAQKFHSAILQLANGVETYAIVWDVLTFVW